VVARDVLAKHDDNCMPPEAAEAIERARNANRTAPGASVPIAPK